MTLPSFVVNAIAQNLNDALKGSESKPRDIPLVKEVKVWDGEFGKDGTSFLTIGDPGVLVACLGGNALEDQSTLDAVFVVYVVAKAKAPDNRSRGLLAGDLAAIITDIVNDNMWDVLDVNGNTVRPTLKIPQRIRAQNEHTEALADKGASVWSVYWTQRIDCKQDVAAELHRLGSIHFTFAMSDDTQVPRELATVVFPEPTP